MTELDVIYNEDCIEGVKKYPDNFFDLVLTDPPFNIAMDKSAEEAIGKWRGSKINKVITSDWDKFTDEEFTEFNRKWITEAFRVTRPKGWCCIFNSFKRIPEIVIIAQEAGFKYQRLFTWAKTNAPLSFPNDFVPSCEYVMIFYKESKDSKYKKHVSKDIVRDFVLTSITGNKEREQAGYHPTVKPIKLMEIFIKKLSHKGDKVLDLFAGSGATLIAAKKHERHFVGFELEKKHYDTCIKRLDNIQDNRLSSWLENE